MPIVVCRRIFLSGRLKFWTAGAIQLQETGVTRAKEVRLFPETSRVCQQKSSQSLRCLKQRESYILDAQSKGTQSLSSLVWSSAKSPMSSGHSTERRYLDQS